MRERTQNSDSIDLKTARDVLESFHTVLGVPCRLFDREGRQLLHFGADSESCVLCRLLQKATGEAPQCSLVHLHGAQEARRFGGRYIYFCPSDMAYFSSPLMLGGQQIGSLVCGPLLIMDRDDYLAGVSFSSALSKEDREVLRTALASFRRAQPEQLSHFSNLLFAIAVYIGGSSLSLLRQRESSEQQQTLSNFIQHLKNEHAPDDYPIAQEEHLAAAIRAGDQQNARRLLDELLGFVMFSSGGSFQELRVRSIELLVVISRAAISGGADPTPALALNRRAMAELDRARSAEDLTLSLAGLIGQYTELVFDTRSLKHRKALSRALDYMGQNYMHPIRLEDVAGLVGFSPNYFSSIFKEEMGCTFLHYLNQIRVENSQVFLLSPDLSILQICNMCGFEDQSYFIKVFKKYTGTTPSRFRTQHSRILYEKERSVQD